MNLNENKRIAIGNPQPAHVVNPSTGSWWNPSFSMPSIPKTPNAQEARLSTLWIIIISMLTYLSNLKHVAKSKYFSWRHITDSPLLQKLFSLQIVLSSVNPVSHMENHFNKKGSWDQIATKMRFQTNQRVKTIFFILSQWVNQIFKLSLKISDSMIKSVSQLNSFCCSLYPFSFLQNLIWAYFQSILRRWTRLQIFQE